MRRREGNVYEERGKEEEKGRGTRGKPERVEMSVGEEREGRGLMARQLGLICYCGGGGMATEIFI